MIRLPFHGFLLSSDFFCSQATASNASPSVLCSLEPASSSLAAPEQGPGLPWAGSGLQPRQHRPGQQAGQHRLPLRCQAQLSPSKGLREHQPQGRFPKALRGHRRAKDETPGREGETGTNSTCFQPRQGGNGRCAAPESQPLQPRVLVSGISYLQQVL